VADTAAIVADCIAGGALLLSGFAVVRGETRQSREKKRRLATGPSEEFREALADMRSVFGTIVKSSGKRAPFFDEGIVPHGPARARSHGTCDRWTAARAT
jgi:hypothetical protein